MSPLEVLAGIETQTLKPLAQRTDAEGRFPRETISALGESGLLGLVSAASVGGQGLGLKEAAQVVSRIAQTCPSTAMIVCMHYCATAVLEQFGPEDTRRAVARGTHLSTLAFSEADSRSHFWAPTGTARADGSSVVLEARTSWVTSACEADASTPITASNVRVPASARLGEDGKGFDTMMGVVLPWFSVLSAACSTGLMEGALQGAIGHVGQTRHVHLGSSLADLPTIRAYLAKGRIKADMAQALLANTIEAIGAGRADTMLRVLEVKAAAAETALEVTDIAMRVCGGAAFRKEAGIERLFRDARASSVMAPTSDVLYDFIGKAVTGLPLF